MGRKVQRKGKKEETKEEKKKLLLTYLDHVRSQFAEYEIRLNSLCGDACNKINKMYADKLKALPEHVRKMTLAEYIADQEKIIQEEEKEYQQNHRSEFRKTKLLSEKKKTLKSKREERKRSMSVLNLTSSVIKSQFSTQIHPVSRVSRVLSESSLYTPLSKRSVAPAFCVTPKFNPNQTINKKYLRMPNPGEMVMSISGSPLQNIVDDIPDRPGVAVSLGNGKIINITNAKEIADLGIDFSKKLNDDIKTTLQDAKRKLELLINIK